MPRARHEVQGLYADKSWVIEHDVERLIDKYGLSTILGSIAQICFEKAEHIRANWQDEPLARAWDRVGKALDRAAADKRVKEVS